MDVPDENARRCVQLRQWAKGLAWVVIAMGTLVLFGWQFDVTFLIHPLPHLVAMNPLTAVAFVTSGCAFLLLDAAKISGKTKLFFYLLVIIPLASGGLKLIGLLTSFDIGVDQLLFSSKIDVDVTDNTPNRMAPNTALNFFLTGFALILANFETSRKRIPSQYAALVVVFMSLLSIIGYIYKVKAFYDVTTYIPMAIHTAFAFLFISLAILFHKPESGLMKVFTSDLDGSRTARLLIPAAITIPVVLGYLRLLAEWYGLFTMEFGAAVLILSIIILFIVPIWYHSNLLNSRDRMRKDAEITIHKLNEALTQTNAQLGNANKELEAFAYSISHDLRAPLRSVIGYSQMLEEDYGATIHEEGRILLKNINRNALRMNALIDDLLSFSKLERAEVQKTLVDMNALTTTAWKDLGNIKPHAADVKIGNLNAAFADAALMHQVVVNLLSNAIKYSSKKEKPLVEVRSEINGKDIVYSVSDNGAGFDMAYAHKLFGVFQRLHKVSDFEGTGVGLAIVQRIILKHGGKVWAEAKPQQGATFYFSLPREQRKLDVG